MLGYLKASNSPRRRAARSLTCPECGAVSCSGTSLCPDVSYESAPPSPERANRREMNNSVEIQSFSILRQAFAIKKRYENYIACL